MIQLPERTAYKDLMTVVEAHGARVHQGVKLSNIVDPAPGPDFDWSTRAEIDLLVRDADLTPLFAMEVDGRHHAEDPRQAHRDRVKDRLLGEAGIDLLRITSQGALRRHGRSRLTSYLANLWFTARDFHDQQEAGHIPPWEPFCHFLVPVRNPDTGRRESVAPDIPVRVRFLAEWKSGRLPVTHVPATWVRYRPEVGLVDAKMLLPAAADRFLYADATVGLGRIPGVIPGDIAGEVAILDLAQQWDLYRSGEPVARHVRDLPKVLPNAGTSQGQAWSSNVLDPALTSWLSDHVGGLADGVL